MKKHLFLCASSLALTLTGFAQQGSVLVAGNVSYELQKGNNPGYDATSNSTFTISPQVGYQFSKYWTAGLVLGYEHDGSTNGGLHSGTHTYWGGPFARYTYPLNSWISLYGQFQATWNSGGGVSIGDTANGPVATYRVIDFYAYPAVFFDIRNGFGLNLSFGGLEYNYSHTKDYGTIYRSFNVNFGSAVLIGLSKNFGGHRKGS